MTSPNELLGWLRSGDFAAARAAAHADRLLLRTYVAEPRAWGEEMWFPLHHAASEGRVDAVRLLLELGVSPDCRTRFHTPLHARETALHLAASTGRAGVVQTLLESGAEVEVRDAAGQSPLTVACRAGHAAVAALLLRYHAIPDAVDGQGRTPLHWSVLVEDSASALAVMDALIAAGCDLDALCPKEADAYTALHRCVSSGESALEGARRLLAAGADARLMDPRFGRTALQLAESLGFVSYVRLFRTG